MNETIVVYAAVPPPEHGQNRMVAAMLRALDAGNNPHVLHVNARFSQTLEQIGEGSLKKIALSLRYISRAILLGIRNPKASLYYVPGPVKLSAISRDWLTLGVLRVFYKNVIFHWHAIGQGEWAHGSERISLRLPEAIDRVARRISACVLERPKLSIAVSINSTRDAQSVDSERILVVPNGIDDPCPEAMQRIATRFATTTGNLAQDNKPPVRLLFLSYGTEEKGLFDLLDALCLCSKSAIWQGRQVRLTLAGGVAHPCTLRFENSLERLRKEWGDRLEIQQLGFVDGDEKTNCYRTHDMFLAPSRWESFGITVVEAMAHGLPIVASASDGVLGILGNDYPFMAAISDPVSFSSRIDELAAQLGHENLLHVSSALRAKFESEFRKETFCSAIRRALEDGTSSSREVGKSPLQIMAYLADQNLNHGRSLGISRMTGIVTAALAAHEDVSLGATVSTSSMRAPAECAHVVTVPWSTRGNLSRAFTDNLYPLFAVPKKRPDVWYFPKGFMPFAHWLVQPSVATIHDTIIQYCKDHYPEWRLDLEYNYWAGMLRNTLRHATAIMTVSLNAKRQIEDFIRRHGLPEREIHVTYEPCAYEGIPQPIAPAKAGHVVHLGSLEPHKRTAWLIRVWAEWSVTCSGLPTLHVIGRIPNEVAALGKACPKIVTMSYLEDHALVSQLRSARALILPSEIEGFGLPAIEAYYLGAPVCFVRGTSVEEILQPATGKGGFHLQDPESLHLALQEVLAMSADEIHNNGLLLREQYHSAKIVDMMMNFFKKAANS